MEDLLLPGYAAIPMLMWAVMGSFQIRATERLLVGILLLGLPCLMTRPLWGLACFVVGTHAVGVMSLMVLSVRKHERLRVTGKAIKALCLLLTLVELVIMELADRRAVMHFTPLAMMTGLVAERSMHSQFWGPGHKRRNACLYSALAIVVFWNMLNLYAWNVTGLRLERSWLGFWDGDWFTPQLAALVMVGLALPSRRLVPMTCLILCVPLHVALLSEGHFAGSSIGVLQFVGLLIPVLGVLLATDVFCHFLDRRSMSTAVSSGSH